jgi:hypothetical protein
MALVFLWDPMGRETSMEDLSLLFEQQEIIAMELKMFNFFHPIFILYP